MKLKNRIKSTAVVFATVACLSGQASAAYTFVADDLLLGFQATGGSGTNTNVFLNLGSSPVFRDNGNFGFIANIGADLSAAFGPDWYTRTNINAGVVGNRSNLSATNDPGTGSQDPGRVFYMSVPTNSAGQSVPTGPYTSGVRGSGGTNYSSLRGIFANLDATASGAAILIAADNPVEWNNSWSKWNPDGGAAFNVFSNIETSFGQMNSRVLLDVYRYSSATDPAVWVSTISIDSLGNVSAIPEPTTALLAGVACIGLSLRRRRA